jgi:prepilin-type processing-associated H-X9-DG protein
LALNHFVAARKHLPVGAESHEYAGNPLAQPHNFYRWSSLAHLTPYMEASAAYKSLDLSVPLYAADFSIFPQNRPGIALLLPEFLCPSDRMQRVRMSFGPTNYAACAGSGIGGGTPFDTDGVFYANSSTRLADVSDGLSKTAAFAETTLGEIYPLGTQRSQVRTRTAYAFAKDVPLTENSCNEVVANWNYQDPGGFAWVSGEYRCALYNHYWLPNANEFDCISAKVSGTLSDIYSAFGWRAARSYHKGGVNLLLLDGSVHFVRDGVNGVIWREISTRAGGEIITADWK